MNLVDPFDGYGHAAGNSGPGWPVNSETEDTRPAYSPNALVWDVIDVLARVGIRPELSPSQLHVARLAAADLLRALGVRPATAPERKVRP